MTSPPEGSEDQKWNASVSRRSGATVYRKKITLYHGVTQVFYQRVLKLIYDMI
jgi:hypothetical protein